MHTKILRIKKKEEFRDVIEGKGDKIGMGCMKHCLQTDCEHDNNLEPIS